MSARKLNVRLSREADRDMLDILLYTLRAWGAREQAIYEAANVQALATLSQYPLAGRARDDRFPGCRSTQVEQHVIYFHQPRAAEIEVLRILHHRQDAGAVVQEPSS